MPLSNLSEAKGWARENLNGLITVLIPTFTQEMKGLNEKAIAHDVRESAKQGFVGLSIITEAGTTLEEDKQLMEIVVKHAKGRILTSLLTTFPTVEENVVMAKYAQEIGVDIIQLGYPAMWYPSSLREVVNYTAKICKLSSLPTILWAADMWAWCNLVEDPHNYPKELLFEFAKIPNVVGIKGGTSDPKVLKEIYSMGVVPGTVKEESFPLWISKFNAQWGGISAYNHLYFSPKYFKLLRDGRLEDGMELYTKMNPIRSLWSQMMKTEVGDDAHCGWTGHNRLRWKYAGWLVGLSGGPVRGSFRIAPNDMKNLRKALLASKIPVTKDEDQKFFQGRFTE